MPLALKSCCSPTALARLVLGVGLAGVVAAAAGCHMSGSTPPADGAAAPSPGQPPTTLPDKFQPATTTPAAAMAKPMPMPAEAKVMPKADPPKLDPMTHTLSKDEPYYTSMPMDGSPPAGTLVAGTKTLLLVPGVKYSKVMIDGGTTAYTMTDGLEPISKK